MSQLKFYILENGADFPLSNMTEPERAAIHECISEHFPNSWPTNDTWHEVDTCILEEDDEEEPDYGLVKCRQQNLAPKNGSLGELSIPAPFEADKIRKYLGKTLQIYPVQLGLSPWSENVQVRFDTVLTGPAPFPTPLPAAVAPAPSPSPAAVEEAPAPASVALSSAEAIAAVHAEYIPAPVSATAFSFSAQAAPSSFDAAFASAYASVLATNAEQASVAAAAEAKAEADADADHWCISVKVPDLALRLDMRHPRVILNFLRFVNSYNELAPEGEKINVPFMEVAETSMIFNHESVRNVVPEFAEDVKELSRLVNLHSCNCPDCDPDDWSQSRDDTSDSEDEYRSRGSRYS